MNKDKLIDKIVNKTNYPKNQVKKCLEETFDIIIKVLKGGGKASIVGFGSFNVIKRKGRKGIDPRTGKEIKVPTVKITRFKAGSKLKKAVK